MFAVANAREAVAELHSRVVTIGELMDGPTCFMAVGEDSEGNQLVIHQRKPKPSLIAKPTPFRT